MKSIVQLLQSKVVLWTKLDEERRLVVARPIMRAKDIPESATLSRRPLKGKRVIVKSRRRHANQRVFIADWPEANQQEMALPKLACIVSGSADYLLGNYCLHANEGTFILIPPRAPHHRSGPFLDAPHRQDGDCTLLFAHAYSHGIYFWFSRSQGSQHINNMADNYLILNAGAVQIFNLLMEEAVANEVKAKSVCNSLLSAFYTILMREIEAGRYTHPGPARDFETQPLAAQDFAGQVQEYIEANLHKGIKVEDAAGQMYISCSQFSRRMRQETGVTFVELLTRCRIERAQELLRETDWTATAISGYVGLKSPAYFHDLFQHRVGCAPIEYRRQTRK